MKQILVTGAGGYLGVPLCKELLKNNYKVIALDRYFFGLDKLHDIRSNVNLTVLKDDLRYVDTAFLKDVDAVIDLAGLSNDASGAINPKLTEAINHKGAARIAHEAKKYGVKRYIYSSSASVYGAGIKTALREGDPLAPLTQYAKSKVAMEQELEKLQDNTFHTTILRNSTIYGLADRMRFDLAINIMTMRAWKDRTIYIMGGGNQWRPFVHVRDVNKAFITCLEASEKKISGEIFNVGSNEQNYQIKQLAQFVVDVVPNVEIHKIPDDPDKRDYNLNFDKISTELGYNVDVRVHEGIVEIKQALEKGIIDPEDPTCFTLQWYKSLLEWNQRIKDISYKGEIL
jgi:nucleoside-diphosphate-sugar epimerase